MLAYNPDDRLTAKQALSSTYLKDLRNQDKRVQQMI